MKNHLEDGIVDKKTDIVCWRHLSNLNSGDRVVGALISWGDRSPLLKIITRPDNHNEMTFLVMPHKNWFVWSLHCFYSQHQWDLKWFLVEMQFLHLLVNHANIISSHWKIDRICIIKPTKSIKFCVMQWRSQQSSRASLRFSTSTPVWLSYDFTTSTNLEML